MKDFATKIMLLALLLPFLNTAPVWAESKPVIKSTVRDVDGQPVAGAYIFFYDSPDTKRAVDLVSPVTDRHGFCQKEVPPGSYWVLARLKKKGDFDMGPLMIEDKLSADPKEITVGPGEVVALEFTVLDLLDTIRTSSKKRDELNRVSGRIVNEDGEPLAKVFAFANSQNTLVTMPEYFSAWTAADGLFTIYLPKGRYYLGATADFAPDQKYVAEVEIQVAADLEKQELVIKSRK